MLQISQRMLISGNYAILEAILHVWSEVQELACSVIKCDSTVGMILFRMSRSYSLYIYDI